MIGIIDYGAGNLLSVKNALDVLGYQSNYVRQPTELDRYNRLILPGVGSFGSCMQNIREQELEGPIMEYIDSGSPFLGICIGLQLLFDQSEESPGIAGLGILPGDVQKFRYGKVPQIGWNKLAVSDTQVLDNDYVYFVNSYHVIPEDDNIIVATSDYYTPFVAAIRQDNILATQFHPEKSASAGLRFLKRWLQC